MKSICHSDETSEYADTSLSPLCEATGMDFKMIGNAAPPMFSEILAKAVAEILFNA